MTPVGKILILPKGRYDADTVYKILDLVMHNGTSWIAKKTVVGIEPSEENVEYWQKLVDIGDAIDHGIEEFFGSGDSSLPLTIPSLTLYNSDNADMRGTLGIDDEGALVFGGSLIFHSLNLDAYLNSYMAKYLMGNSFSQNKIVSYVGTGECGVDNPCSVTLNFAPRMLLFLGEITDEGKVEGFDAYTGSTNAPTMRNIILCDNLTTEYVSENTGLTNSGLSEGNPKCSGKKSEDGKIISWYGGSAKMQCNEVNHTYYFLAI
jgi:hypothetical protein